MCPIKLSIHFGCRSWLWLSLNGVCRDPRVGVSISPEGNLVLSIEFNTLARTFTRFLCVSSPWTLSESVAFPFTSPANALRVPIDPFTPKGLQYGDKIFKPLAGGVVIFLVTLFTIPLDYRNVGNGVSEDLEIFRRMPAGPPFNIPVFCVGRVAKIFQTSALKGG